MIYKYYSMNITTRDGLIIGSAVQRVYFWVNPLALIDVIRKEWRYGSNSFCDLKRIK